LNIDLTRYLRQIILQEIGIEGQEKIKNSKVLVIGAGGIGCPVLSYIASAGIGTIGVLDFDIVDKSNLQRQILFNESQVGLPKAITAVEYLNKLNSEIIFNTHNCYLNSKNGFEILKNYDLIIDATDNFKSRYLINDICVNLSKPFLTGAVNKFEAHAAVLNFNDGPTYRCIYPIFPNESSVTNCEESGVIGSLCGIVGSILSTEVIKIVTGSGSLLTGKILFINALNMEFRKIKIERNQQSVDEAFKLRERVQQ
jgi:adenylyltransferase/sulfurtransferase